MYIVYLDRNPVGHPFDRFRAALAYAISLLEDRIAKPDSEVVIADDLHNNVLFRSNTETWEK